jgi:uncharacterized protein involved in exopolysaccharide biosynthesis
LSIISSTLPVPAPPGGPPPLLPPPAESEEASSGISTQQIQCILKAFWKHSLITFLGIMLVSAFEIRSMPKMYVATAQLLVHHDISKDPFVAQGAQVAVQGNQDSFIPTQIELINSPSVLQAVIDRLDLGHDNEFTHGFKGTPNELREVVVGNLQSSLTVSQGKGSQLLYIAASYPAANRAADIANAVAKEYLRQERMRVNEPASERVALYTRDLQDLKQKVTEAQERVTEFKKQHSLIDVEVKEGGPDIETAALNDLQAKLIAAQTARRELESRQLDPDGSPEAVLKDPTVVALRTTLGQDEEKMALLLTTEGPKHPEVMQLQAQINTTKRSLQNEVQAISRNIQTQLAQARELEAKYQRDLDAQRATTVERRSLRDQAGSLMLQLESAQATYKKALDGYDVSRFDSATDNGDVSLVASASPPARAEKPDKAKLFMMACMAALAVGLGWPFAYELLIDRRLRCRDDLERTFGVPVLAQFGPIGVGSA